jgi:heat shock protein HslJ
MRPLASLCALLGVAACVAAPREGAPQRSPEPPASLVGTRWVGVVDAGADPRTLPRLEFIREGRLTGYTGCNLMSGAWRVEGDEVRLGPIVTTKRLCVGPEAEVERRLLAAIQGRVTREGERLVAAVPGGARFEFTRAQVS